MILLLITGMGMLACFGGMALLPGLRQHTVAYLVLYTLAFAGYALAVAWSLREDHREHHAPRSIGPAVFELCLSQDTNTAFQHRSALLILGLAILFRVALLLSTPPALSDDVYRYIWDGRLLTHGINPYAHAIDSPALDALDTPLRHVVNHRNMASPYLPIAQLYFALVYRLGPDSPLAFQIAAALLDLLSGGIVYDLLRRTGLPATRALVYLWNPLVVVEFAHGAHVDALMIFLLMSALWLMVGLHRRAPAVVALAAATLTKGIPLLVAPLLARRWRTRHLLLYGALLVGTCIPFAAGAGWGLIGPADGVGLFGALRIYITSWRFNAGLYHWLEAALARLWGGAQATLPWQPILVARLMANLGLGAVVIATWRWSKAVAHDVDLLRLLLLPLGGYLLLAPTVHPWYVTLLLPLLPFLPSPRCQQARFARVLWAGIYCSWAVALSYLTYLAPATPQELSLVRLVEYLPLYALLLWSIWPSRQQRVPGT